MITSILLKQTPDTLNVIHQSNFWMKFQPEASAWIPEASAYIFSMAVICQTSPQSFGQSVVRPRVMQQTCPRYRIISALPVAHMPLHFIALRTLSTPRLSVRCTHAFQTLVGAEFTWTWFLLIVVTHSYVQSWRQCLCFHRYTVIPRQGGHFGR